MVKILKAIKEYFPHIIMWLDSHKVYGGFVFVVMLIAATMSGYALNKEESLKDKVDSVQNCIEAEMDADKLWRSSIESRMDVMDGKLDLLVKVVTK